ncbi:MAG: cytochrome c oxidase subunit II [Luteibaculaceae bacterium]
MTNLLIILIIVAAVFAIAQISRVYELSAKLRDEKEYGVHPNENKLNANLWMIFMVAFYGFIAWQIFTYKDHLLPQAATEHGALADQLLVFNWWILFTAFFLVETLLFVFSWKYAYSAKRKAAYYPDNNKLELLWTVVPSVVLFIIIAWGLKTWVQITAPASEDALIVELYSRQFDWAARYAGEDGEHGLANFTLVSGTNPLGLITPESIEEKVKELETEIADLENRLENEVMPDSRYKTLKNRLGSRVRQKNHILRIEKENSDQLFMAYDDVITKGEFMIPVGREIKLEIKSQDVTHSAFIPHFRVQMNAVPGKVTSFKFTPTITTAEMREITGNPDFNYVLMCNKICGAAHFNMQMEVIVGTEEEYLEWLSEQKTFLAGYNTTNNVLLTDNK